MRRPIRIFLDKMATYVRVVEAGSFSAAAKQLRISSGAVSRQIASLRRRPAKNFLLRRSTRRMELTTEGRRYYAACLRVLREVEDAQAAGRGTGHGRGPAPDHGAGRVRSRARRPACRRKLMTKNPGLRVRASPSRDRLLDLALSRAAGRRHPGREPACAYRGRRRASARFCSRRVLVASPAYLEEAGEARTPPRRSRSTTRLTYTGPGLAGEVDVVRRSAQRRACA